ncbi:hypothetical protein LPJ73_001357 [Coemansia sp. RSA 2703]|nr:hypothetical protein LPJ73_001357 [Coemansia sp. RSA 2703]
MRSSAINAQTFGSESHANVARSPRMAGTSARGSVEQDEPPTLLQHERTSSTASSVQRQQSPAFPPHLAVSGPSQTFNGNHHAGPGAAGRRGSSGTHDTNTPPRIRQTRSEMHPKSARAGSSSGSSVNGHSIAALVGSGSNNSNADDASRTNYSLWLPWEETALIDWLYEPNNCKLFNEPRRKKECHERIIREILPSKTSRAIEGKIRTLEKRYLKAASEIHRPDFATKHPGKHPDDVSEMLCNNFYKLETIFNPSQAQTRSQIVVPHLPTHQQPQSSKKIWSSSVPPPLEAVGAGISTSLMPGVPFAHSSHPHSPTLVSPSVAGAAATLTTTPASSAVISAHAPDTVPGSSVVSIPRASPPRLANTESLPYRLMGQTRKIAPKRGADGSTEVADGDGPTMMSESKRSRTFPTMMPNHGSPPGRGSSNDQRSAQQMHALMQQQQQQQQHQHAPRPQRSPMNIQHLQIPPSSQQQQHQHQQYRLLENGRYSLDIGTRPATATLPLMPIPSPMGGVNQVPSSAGHQATAAGGSVPVVREPQENNSNSGGQVQAGMPTGSREELEWLQFNLRREELEFRKNAFAHEQEMETQRVRLESHRLEIQKREMELEAKRIETQQRQMDVQVESLRSLTTMLGQMVGQMGALIAANVGGTEAAHPAIAAATAASAAPRSHRQRLESTPEEDEEEGEEQETT